MTLKTKEKILNEILKASLVDKILVIADYKNLELGVGFTEYLVAKGFLPDFVVMPVTKNDGDEPSIAVGKACESATVIVAFTVWSITHTLPVQKAKKSNPAKVISVPNANEKLLDRTVAINYSEVKEKALVLDKLISNQKEILITTSLGTNLKISTKGYKANPMYGEVSYGQHINLPDGECSVGVENADGTLVIDGSMPPDNLSIWGMIGLIETPITLTIKNGYVVKIAGGKQAQVLSKILNSTGKDSYKIAEFGIGLNPKARILGNVTEDEKVLGTIHIALGNNIGLGGTNYAKVHLDAVIRNPTVLVEDQVIINNGYHEYKYN
ncbi:MAG: aminopeptidase [bacterium]|nr:aminopeptidase [bacterium]